MGIQTLTNCKLFVGGHDLSGDINALALKYGAEAKETTTFASAGFRERLPGLKDGGFQHEGIWSAGVGNVDETLFAQVAGAAIVTISPQSGAEGEIAYSGQYDFTDYAPGERVGEVLKFSVAGQLGAGDLVRGTILHNAARTTDGNGTITNLGAIASGKKIYAALHILGVQGTGTFDCKIQSAALVGFGSPTDRITFDQADAIGAQWGTPVAGAITDAYWRVVYAITGFTSVTFAVIAGIQ